MTTATVNAKINPKIQARRVEILRSQGRRRRRIILISAVAVSLIATAWWLSGTEALDVDQFEISGVSRFQVSEVLEASKLQEGVPMISLDTKEAAKGVESLPWVESVEVNRRWPNQVTLNVTERNAVAIAPTKQDQIGQDQIGLVDAFGYVFAEFPASAVTIEPTRSPDLTGLATAHPALANVKLSTITISTANLPTPEAATGNSSAIQITLPDLPVIDVAYTGELGGTHVDASPALSAVAALPMDLNSWVSSISVNGNSVRLNMVGGAQTELGNAVLMDHKMTALRSILANVDLQCVTQIDVSMADSPTVRRHPNCPTNL